MDTQTSIAAAPQHPFVDGVRAILPVTLGVFPFALISGIVATEGDLNLAETMGMSVLIFAGASQLASVQLLSAGANAAVILLTAWIINLRFLLYSASLAPHFKELPTRLKALIAYTLTDQAYSISIIGFEHQGIQQGKHWFYLGAALVTWVLWQIGTLVGALLGAQIPASWQLDFTIPLVFLALLVPALRDRAALAAAVMAGAITVAGSGLPFNLGLPLGTLVGILVGLAIERGQQ